jgi:hypothetical protein
MSKMEDTPRDTREGVQRKNQTGRQDSSPDAARKIAKSVEDQGGFWGKRKSDG